MKIEVKRITAPNLFRECAEMTTGKPCKMSWNKALCSGHSIIRAEEYLIKLYDIPQCVMGHLVRHVHSQPFVLSKRPDRGGLDFKQKCDDIILYISEAEHEYIHGRSSVAKLQIAVNQMLLDIASLPTLFNRHAPTNMGLKLNAEEIINISKVRLCSKASAETREVWRAVVDEIRKIDPDLANHCQPTCVFRGGICPEPKSCSFNKTELFKKQLDNYKTLFTK